MSKEEKKEEIGKRGSISFFFLTLYFAGAEYLEHDKNAFIFQKVKCGKKLPVNAPNEKKNNSQE